MPLPPATFPPPPAPPAPAPGTVTTTTPTNTIVLPPAVFTRTSTTAERNSFSDAGTLNDSARKSKPTSLNTAARNKAKPLIYGSVYLGTNIIDAFGGNGAPLTVLVGVGMGLITQIESWFINDAAPPVTATLDYLQLGGVNVVSSFLTAKYGAIGKPFYDTFYGDVVMAVTIEDDGTFKSFPSITVRAKGRKCFDPRRGDHDISNPNSWSYTRNSALIHADFASSGYARYTGLSPRYGLAQRIDIVSLIDAANWCDELLGVSSTEPRCRTDIAMIQPGTNRQWAETLRTLGDFYTDVENGKVKYIPDRPRLPVFAFDATNIKDVLYHNLLSLKDQPSSVEVQYVNAASPDLPPPQSSVVSVDPDAYSTNPNSAQQIALQGCSRVGQALRHARKRRIALRNAREELGLTVFSEALQLQKADVVDIVLPDGTVNNENFVIDRKRSLGNGLYELHLTNYRPYANDDSVTLIQPVYNPPSQYTCNESPVVYELTLTQLNRIENGVCQRRMGATWNVNNAACIDYYRIDMKVNGVQQLPTDVPNNEFLSVPFTIGTTIEVTVTPVANINNPIAGAPVTATLLITSASC